MRRAYPAPPGTVSTMSMVGVPVWYEEIADDDAGLVSSALRYVPGVLGDVGRDHYRGDDGPEQLCPGFRAQRSCGLDRRDTSSFPDCTCSQGAEVAEFFRAPPDAIDGRVGIPEVDNLLPITPFLSFAF